jgi:hypothetical protein
MGISKRAFCRVSKSKIYNEYILFIGLINNQGGYFNGYSCKK